jgi:hypothetical protein
MNELQLTASGTIPGYSCVKLVGSDQVGVTTSSSDVVFGVTTYSQKASGEVIELQTDENSTRLLRAGGTIAAGDFLVPASNGAVVKSSDGGGQFIATEAATSGQNVWALLSNSKSSSTQINYLAPGSSTTKEVSSKLAEQLSVKDFGAVGDGVTDDTAAIQAALDAAAAPTVNGIGKAVFVPSGKYKTTATLELKEGTRFYGQQGTSVIDVQPSAITSTVTNGLLIKGNNVVIDGLRFDGTNEGREINGGTNIDLYATAILANPQITGSVYQSATIKNCSIFKWGSGIELRRCNNFAIIDNRLWGGKNLKDGNGPNASTFDISIYGSSSPNDSFRGIISGNFCFGNQDVNISAGGNSGDHDITINGNVIWPLKEDLTPLSQAATLPTDPDANMSRYGILTGYGGNCSLRMVVSNNVIRDVAHSGINTQTATRPGGDLAIVGNVISQCGFGKIYPGDNSLKAAIFMDGGADRFQQRDRGLLHGRHQAQQQRSRSHSPWPSCPCRHQREQHCEHRPESAEQHGGIWNPDQRKQHERRDCIEQPHRIHRRHWHHRWDNRRC